MPLKKKLIEVALPLEAINAESAREKSIRHGHPSTLHLWWARRPLATARAVIWSSLVDDPSSHPEQCPTEEAQQQEQENAKSAERARISRELAEFQRAFPDAYDNARKDPKSIPQSVWAEVNNGLSLTAAYSRYAVQQARESVKTAQETVKTVQQTQKNAQRSTGSMKSAGNDAKNTDPFLAGFGS